MFNTLFRNRIGVPVNEDISFTKLDYILEKTATSIPFENLAVLTSQSRDINKENMLEKILLQNEGGLCYELNTTLFYFLAENDFDVKLVRGVVYDHTAQAWGSIGKTHVAIFLFHNDSIFLVDTGFGGNLPLRPVPLTGETVISFNGEFRVKKENSEHGDYILEMKLKHKDPDWKIGYAFDSTQLVGDISELNEVQKIIREHPKSLFNKHPLISKLTNNGSVTLTATSFTQWMNGEMTKETIDDERFNQLLTEYFARTLSQSENI